MRKAEAQKQKPYTVIDMYVYGKAPNPGNGHTLYVFVRPGNKDISHWLQEGAVLEQSWWMGAQRPEFVNRDLVERLGVEGIGYITPGETREIYPYSMDGRHTDTLKKIVDSMPDARANLH